MSEASTPTISIITPTYNRKEMVARAIASVQSQGYSDWEMIVVDDGSTDGTRQQTKAVARDDSRIRYFHQENQGPGAARNHAIREARGAYLAFLDSDDAYLPGGLAILAEALDETPSSVKLVYGNFMKDFVGTGRSVEISVTPPFERPRLYLQFMVGGMNPILPSAALVERQAIIDIGMFDESYRCVGDGELWLRLVEKHDIRHVNRLTSRYRKHPEQLTAQFSRRRYYRDRVAYEFARRFPLQELYPGTTQKDRLAKRISQLAVTLLKTKTPSLDTAIYLLRVAQSMDFTEKRENFLQHLVTTTDGLLQKRFGEVMRIETENP